MTATTQNHSVKGQDFGKDVVMAFFIAIALFAIGLIWAGLTHNFVISITLFTILSLILSLASLAEYLAHRKADD